MQDQKIANIGRRYNSSKNKVLGEELEKFLNGEYKDAEDSRIAFRKLLKVIAGRLKTL